MYPDINKKEKSKQEMKADIILSGVGGQGILSIAAVIGEAALKEGLYMKQAEVHGMSQRGGDVQSNLRLSDQPIASDLIPLGQADLIISLEPMEALRYLPYLKKDGWLVTNSQPFINIPNYPEMGKVLRKVMPKSYILVPGYGAQGGQGKDLVHFFNEDGLGAIVNSSRGIIAAYKQEAYAKFGAENFGDASRAAVEAMVADIQGALETR